MQSTIIKNANVVNEGRVIEADILIEGEFIAAIEPDISADKAKNIMDVKGKYVFPGVIDDQVHFRDPGLTHKADLSTESKAAVAGGVTSFMEMPNTNPQTTTQDLLVKKYELGSAKSLANYSFYMGATNDNLDEILKTEPNEVCGIKVFMGSSTGNMLVDNTQTLEKIFKESPLLIAVHAEDEKIIQRNLAEAKERFGDEIPMEEHPRIRSEEACYQSSSRAVQLAKDYGSKLHVLHISTAKETSLFENKTPLEQKKITAEACIHHLWFNDSDYAEKGSLIKWNPAVKSKHDQKLVFESLLGNQIDVIATDHAPHTLEEKRQGYLKAPSGGPMIQHSLVAMLEFYHRGKLQLERIVEKMCHNPAIIYQIDRRGFLREGFFADLTIVDLLRPWSVSTNNLYYKCGWSPFEGQDFNSMVLSTFVNGHLAYHEGRFDEAKKGSALRFNR